ncbi:MAG: hypothetical protein ACLVJ6_07765 [Merdibacter sp.]
MRSGRCADPGQTASAADRSRHAAATGGRDPGAGGQDRKELLDQSESLSGTLSIGAAECEAARVLLPQLVKRFHQLHRR